MKDGEEKKNLPGIGGDNVTETDDDNVTGHDHARLDFNKGTITENLGLESERVLEGIQCRLGLGLLDEADERVDEQKGEDDAKVDLFFFSNFFSFRKCG